MWFFLQCGHLKCGLCVFIRTQMKSSCWMRQKVHGWDNKSNLTNVATKVLTNTSADTLPMCWPICWPSYQLTPYWHTTHALTNVLTDISQYNFFLSQNRVQNINTILPDDSPYSVTNFLLPLLVNIGEKVLLQSRL